MGMLQVNGNINATGSIGVNNNNSAGGIWLWEDGEGGTLTIASKNNTYVYHIDAHNDETIRIHTADKNPNGAYKQISWNGKTGILSADGFNGTATNSNQLGGIDANLYFRRRDNITGSCNNAMQSSSYWVMDTATDKPTSTYWGALVDFDTGSHHQLFFSYTGNDAYVGLYTRAKVNDTWQPWTEFLHTENVGSYAVKRTIINTYEPNFNNLTSTSWYSIVTSNTNSPTPGNHGLLLGEFAVGTPFQIWYPDNSMAMYKRYKPSGSDWTAWSNTWDINITGSAGSASLAGAITNLNGNDTAGYSGEKRPVWMSWSDLTTGRPALDSNFTYQTSSSTLFVPKVNIGGKVELWSDGEGGNIRLTSPNGSWWSIDALSNSSMRFIWAEASVPFAFGSDGTLEASKFKGSLEGYFYTPNTAGYYTDQYGNFHHNRSSTTDHWQIHSYDGSFSLKYYADTGEMRVRQMVAGALFLSNEYWTGYGEASPQGNLDAVIGRVYFQLI